jgi:molybdenum cofactor cytidylyltransferase
LGASGREKITVGGIILAAGMSKRMRRNKLLIRLGAQPIITLVLKAALSSRLSDVTLVAGEEVHEFAVGLHCDTVKIVANRSPEFGMSHSLRLGLKAVGDVRGAMLILGDQPFINGSIIDTLIETFEEDPAMIVAPLIMGRRSQPTLFPKRLFPELLEVTGDKGGRSVIASHPGLLRGVEVGDRYDDMDVDTPEDLVKANAVVEK